MGGDRDSRVILITGATSGIGYETARRLAAGGATVVVGARDPQRGKRVCESIESTGAPAPQLVVADLSVLGQVRRMAAEVRERFGRLDVLINNAGVDVGRRVVTEDGFELTFAVNYLAPFVLTTSLLDALRSSTPARVLNVVSSGHRAGRIDFADLQHEKRFSGQRAYSDAKLALVAFTYELARRLAGSGVTANCVDPGFVRGTKLGQELPLGYKLVGALLMPFMVSPARASAGVLWAATSADLQEVTGAYLKRGKRISSSKESMDTDLAARLWQTTETLVSRPGRATST